MKEIRAYKTWISLGALFLVGAFIWFCSIPQGVSSEAWHLFAIFTVTLIGIILKPFPMSVISLIALTVAIVTNTLPIVDAFSGFSNEIVWLVVFAFFISRGFISTGLGSRIAYQIMSVFGKNSLGLGYGLVLTDLILAPTIPSVTARIGGVVFPILKSINEVFTGPSHDPKMGAFLTQVTFQGSMITSAMFLTSMAGNPLIAEIAKSQGIDMTWGSWLTAAIVPGILSLIFIPYILHYLAPPSIQRTPHARAMALEKLEKLGPMKRQEKIMLGAFVLLIVLWVMGPYIGMKATAAAMVGMCVLLITKIIQWQDVLQERGAWDTFIWFSILITFAAYLNKLGFIAWMSHSLVFYVEGFHWVIGFILICLMYFYSHYLFVSCVAHISAMYIPLLMIAIAIGTPPGLAAFVLGFFSSLMGALTHYGTGQAPILFSTGYLTTGQWWGRGLVCSFANIFIWLVFGGLWWKVLGLW